MQRLQRHTCVYYSKRPRAHNMQDSGARFKEKKVHDNKTKNQTSKKKKHAWEALQFLLFLTIYLHYKYILYLLNSDFSARWTKLNGGTKARTWMRLVDIHRVFHIILTQLQDIGMNKALHIRCLTKFTISITKINQIKPVWQHLQRYVWKDMVVNETLTNRIKDETASVRPSSHPSSSSRLLLRFCLI